MVVDRIYSRIQGLGILIAYEEIYREYCKRRYYIEVSYSSRKCPYSLL